MDINSTLENLRVSYQAAELDVKDCDKNPINQFDMWFEHALETKCDEPNAFILSTASHGRPHARVLLLKGVHDEKFVFYTNYNSAKGNEVSNNDKVAMTFLWLPLQRQVRIEGSISKVSEKLSDDYFHKRPRGSQLGAIASPQSQVVADRSALERMFSETQKKFEGQEVLPRPVHWGGYEVVPEYIEFWQGRKNRMHDRIAYEKSGTEWKLSRLAP
jgi:pyridoxamine 5'-phosphate oxidase